MVNLCGHYEKITQIRKDKYKPTYTRDQEEPNWGQNKPTKPE